MSENFRVTKAAGVVGSATFLSRLLGFVRDMVIAGFLGAGLSADAFFAAFRIPNLFRKLFAEGSLSISFVPVFTEYLTRHGRDEAFAMARAGLRLLSALLVIVALLGIVLSPWVIRLIAPGFSGLPEKFDLAVSLNRIMFPYLLFVCLTALCMGILNVLGHFTAPALAPVLLNMAMIASVFMLSPFMQNPASGLAFGVVIGGILQLALQMPFLVKQGFFFWQKARLYHPGLKKVGLLMIPAIFGAAVYQVNILVGTLLASLLPQGSISYLYYADRLVQFPHGIFALATATAVLPSFSRQAAANDLSGLRDTFAYALKLVFFITLPAMVGLIVLREPIIALLFKRGAFDETTTRLTASALMYYGIGLWAFSAVRILVSMFYALKDVRTPVKMGVAAISANILLGVTLMKPMGHDGIALATSIASMLNLILLARALRNRLGPLGWKEIAVSVSKSLGCALAMGVVVAQTARATISPLDAAAAELLMGTAGSVASGLIVYGGVSCLIQRTELRQFMAAARKREEKGESEA